MSLAATLKELRKNREKSLQEVADAVNASKAHIWELETGKSRNPSMELLEKLATYFQVTVSQLVGEMVNPDDPEAMMLNRHFKQLEQRDKNLIMAMVQQMTNAETKSKSGNNDT